MTHRTFRLSPRDYVRFPWKNGAGVTTDIAARYREGEPNGDWSAVLWRFGRTAIIAPGPFSDLAGFDRWQVVVAGRGLKLDTAAGEIDLSEPFVPKRYPGEAPIVSRLEAGPVEVVNLIVARGSSASALATLAAGDSLPLAPGSHIAYAPGETLRIEIDGARHTLAADHALRIEAEQPAGLAVIEGRGLLASILPP